MADPVAIVDADDAAAGPGRARGAVGRMLRMLGGRRAGDDIAETAENHPPPDAGAGWEGALFAALQTPADDRPEPQAEPPARVEAPDYHTVLHRDRVTLLQLVPYLWTHGGDGIMLLLAWAMAALANAAIIAGWAPAATLAGLAPLAAAIPGVALLVLALRVIAHGRSEHPRGQRPATMLLALGLIALAVPTCPVPPVLLRIGPVSPDIPTRAGLWLAGLTALRLGLPALLLFPAMWREPRMPPTRRPVLVAIATLAGLAALTRALADMVASSAPVAQRLTMRLDAAFHAAWPHGPAHVQTMLHVAAPVLLGLCALVGAALVRRGARHTQGAERRRLVTVAVGGGVALAAILVSALEPPILAPGAFAVEWLALALVVHAVVAARVGDFGHVAQRITENLMVFALIPAGFALALQAEAYGPPLPPRLSAWSHAAIAMALTAAVFRLHAPIARVIRRALFPRRLDNVAALRRFAVSAAHFEDDATLLRTLAEELEHFTGGALVAVYRRTGRNRVEALTRCAGSWNDAPVWLPADDPALARMRAARAPVELDTMATALPGTLALPLFGHGSLGGLVLLGLRGDGALYRPDEIAAMGMTTHAAGTALALLRADLLETEIRLLKAQLTRLTTIVGDRA